ncbi:potassium transporter [Coniochaeta ligniaria NRRL 30616]|uniref:Potassium transporter n=1 Tax=Coniochaeta ligniaria NRRL 30616 TaxID=1408157 RepID=A0A1J7K3A7_9PEZI|nr:potassium transporter [Coniochaeta ligniaria NRRL 30616]
MASATGPTIKIQEELHPVRSATAGLRSPGAESAYAGGIYHTRSISRASFDRRSHITDVEDGDDWQHGLGRTKQEFHGKTLFWLAYQSIGVIYGDIGTSPLYVFSSTFTSVPSYEALIQVLSVVIWSLTLVVTVKYVLIVLRADNEGEGGTFSCYSLLTRYANLTDRDPREQVLVRMERAATQDMRRTTRSLRATIEKSSFFRGLLKTIGVLAVSMVMADGVLTPAQSVLGAVQGLAVVKSDISSSTVVGTSCGILIVLFLLQPFGTSKLASAFAPIVIVWLAFNFGFGVYNLATYDWTVLKAFSPYYAFQFFVQHKTEAWRMLGGILLAFTGVEALFADLGAFSIHAIQLSWMCYTYPCLLLAYLGQAAYISFHPDAYSNPFFNAVPHGWLYPSLVVAVLAAIVASQAIITATFQLVSQIMKLSYCPQVKVVHTSKTFHGQLYVPFLNWILLCGTILVTAVFSNTTRLGNAYGVCVIFVCLFDTCMVTLVALLVWGLSPYVVIIPWLFFACIDGLYLSSALTKVPDGAWLTLTLAGILSGLFLLWRFGKESQWKAEAEDRIKPSSLVARDGEGKLRLTERWGGDPLSVVRGFGIFFDKTGVMTPSVFTHFASKFTAVSDVMVFFHLHPVETPSVPDDERYSVSRFTAIPGCYRLVVKHGFMDEVISPDLAALIYEQLRKFVIRQASFRAAELALEKEKIEQIEDEQEAAPEEGETVEQGEAAGSAPEDQSGAEQDIGERTSSDDKDINTTSATIAMTSAQTDSTTATTTGRSNPSASGSATLNTPTNVLSRTTSRGDGGSSPYVPPPTPAVALEDKQAAAELARLDWAFAAKILYVVGKEQMAIRASAPLGRRVALSIFLWIRDNTRAKIANLRLAMDRVVEVGFVKYI